MRQLFRQVVVYGSGRIALQLLGLVTLPILTRIFSVAEYGVIETLTATIGVVAVVAGLSLDAAAQREYFATDSASERRVVLSTAFWAIAAWATALTAAMVVFRGPLSALLFGDERYASVVGLAALALPISLAATFYLEVLRLRQQPGRYVLVSWFGAGFSVVLILYLVAVADRGLEGFYLAGVITAIPTLVVVATLARGAIGFRFDPRRLVPMLAYSLPVLVLALTSWGMLFLDRFFLLHFASLREVGLYALANRLAGVLLLLVSAFLFAFSPYALAVHARDPVGERELRRRVLTYAVAGSAFVAVVLTAFARPFFLVVTPPAFEQAHEVVGILCLGIVALAVNAVASIGIVIARRTRFFAQYAITAAVANVLLNTALIPPFGITGAAIATALSQAVLALLTLRRSQRLEPISVETRRAIALFVLAGACCAVATLVVPGGVRWSVALGTAVVGTFTVAAWAFGLLDARARAFLHLPSLRAG